MTAQCDVYTCVKVMTFRAMTKKRSSDFFKKKWGDTPSVAAPGDTNPSDATVNFTAVYKVINT